MSARPPGPALAAACLPLASPGPRQGQVNAHSRDGRCRATNGAFAGVLERRGPATRSSSTSHEPLVPLPRQDGPRIYIVLEYCAGGDLGRYIRRYGRVSEATARYFLVQLAEGLKELRRHNVIHVSRRL